MIVFVLQSIKYTLFIINLVYIISIKKECPVLQAVIEFTSTVSVLEQGLHQTL